ncbi:MAG: UDP-N-acetylenolpyruvoylglucosamine reductase [Parcubacteria group bacterium RIFCSPLOWO2_01_FULL_48_18]|nr:MAG: UDP-N-acetylenolpyruvoylglucosamine reductase [Parcubacteria group bacterium RIFCSPHIGHO2_02_FULL_48_10b]OHB23421.1 MAG: UDP-N-acetylenolpyruvoylglucosamine reductase [Parcubacteria group bacterium RIFCSPLOWO2_01_FULL_48_18]
MLFEKYVDVSSCSNYRIGGPADFFYIARTVEDIEAAVQEARGAKLSIFILAGGTNILFSEKGVRGLVLKIANDGIESLDGCRIKVGAGVLMKDLLGYIVARGLSGLEWAGGLPGTVGGAIRGNAGAFGGEMKDRLVEVRSLDIAAEKPVIKKRQKSECEFDYRMSVFRRLASGEIVLDAVFQMEERKPELIEKDIQDKIKYREERHPLEYPNIGSIFKNIPYETFPEESKAEVSHIVKTDPFPVVPTAYLISEAGLKGVSSGGAMISPKHPNFIVNYNHATSEDVKALIRLAKDRVKEKYHVELREEIEYA